MPALPKWTALPATFDLLEARMLNVTEYPLSSSQGKARCDVTIGTNAPVVDPHDWRTWRTGTFMASYDGRVESWPLQIRRCAACDGIEVRIVRQGRYVPSLLRQRRVFKVRPRPIEDELVGWYHGSPQH
jgi:hypothetical protein